MGNGESSACRICEEQRLFPVVDLGETPIANDLVDPATLGQEPRYPLVLVGCPVCGLVQLEDDLPADVIFDENYSYLSSTSTSLLEHHRAHALSLVETRQLGPENLVIEVASNDGYLLRNFHDKGVPVLGIEPTPLPASIAREFGINSIEEFCGREVAEAIVAEHGRADVVLANNVLAHVPDINDFFSGLTTLLADDGVLEIENPHIYGLVENLLFDTIYHEHYSYLSCTAVAALAGRHGLVLNDVTPFDELHGGTYRWTLSRRPEQSETARRLLAEEEAVGIRRPEFYGRFAERVAAAQDALRSVLTELKAEGKRVAAYGCAAKGATLLNSSGIGVDLIDYVVDLNPLKNGKAMPGAGLLCRPPSDLLVDKPDVLLILAWNFAPEIVEQQQGYAAIGGRFLVPLPEPSYLDA